MNRSPLRHSLLFHTVRRALVIASVMAASVGPASALPLVRGQWRASPVLIQYVEFSPDGTRLVTADGGGVGRVWSLQGQALAVLKGQRAPMFRAHFSADGQSLMTTGYDGTGWLWSATGGEPLRRMQLHRAATADVLMLPPQSGLLSDVVSSSDDGTVVIQRADGERLWSGQFSGTARQLRSTPQGELIAASSDSGMVHLISPSPDRRSARLRSFQTPHGRINLIRFSPDIQQLAVAGADGTITISALDGSLIQQRKASTKGWARGLAYCSGQPGGMLSVGDDGVLRQWSPQGELMAALTLSPAAPLTGVDCAPSGQVAAVVNGTGQLWLLDLTP